MMSKKYVPDGVWLTCDKGTCMSQLKITFHERTTIYGSNLATEGDRWPFVNIKPMGMCMMTRCSCLPTPVLWRKVKEGIYINRHRLLLEDSEAQCMCGGTIRIHFTKEAAMAAAPWGSFKKPSEYIKDFFDWGMKALADGESNTKALLTKLGAPSWMMKSYEALSWGMQMNAGIVEGVLNAVVGTGELIWDIAQDPVGVGGAVVDGVCEAAGDAWEWASKGDNWKQAASDSWDYMSSPEKWKQSAQEASAWVKNNPRALGNVAGEVLETAAEVALTAGAATAVRASAKGVQEVAEAGLKKATKELVEEGAEKAAKEATEKAAKEVAEEATEQTGKRAVVKTNKSLREQYLGRTPGKNSKTGREVFERMKNETPPRARINNGEKEFWDKYSNKWRNISEADMGHIEDAVHWWNREGKKYGAKSKEVRKWMLDSDNYELEYYKVNRSRGAKLTETYDPPLK
ncbi:PAAR-like protein [Bacteroides heparinolyticus]|uniref:PAAR-like protein n=2 Tax=Prevotella heparinolytica TaxID=28113 RepID=UPI00359F933D